MTVCGSEAAGAEGQGGGGGIYRSPVPWPCIDAAAGGIASVGFGAAGGALPAPDCQDEAGRRWRWIGSKRVRMMSKLDEPKVQWIVRQRRNGVPASQVAEAMKVSTRWVGSLVARYKGCEIGDIVFPQPMGWPRGGLPGRLEETTVVSAYYVHAEGATLLADSIEHDTGLRIPHHAIHAQLVANGLAVNDPRKSGQRSTARYVKRAVARRTPESKSDVWPALCATVERDEVPVSKMFEWVRFADPAAAAGPGQ